MAGEDAAAFLQGQFSNDLRSLARGASVYGLWLDHKGRVQADSFAVPGRPGEIWLGSYRSPAAALRATLESHIVADDVTVDDATSAWEGVTVWGAADGELVPADPDARVFEGRRSTEPCRDWVFPRAAGDRVRQQLAGARVLAAMEVERLRIRAGIPAIPLDLGPRDLPHEGGLGESAVSYTKGCYLGQEVMSRLKSMGQVRRRLLRVQGPGAAPACPAPLFQSGVAVGDLRSAVADGDGFVGLAMLAMLKLREGEPLQLSAEPAASPSISILHGG